MNQTDKEIAAAVSAWFETHGRVLPWREHKDPYAIWISEIMLQQTQAATVIPYFKRFIRVLPDVYALAGADIDTVYKLWEGLGYYRRAAHLKETAGYIVSELEGRFPDTYEGLIRLKGIGDYTASAIASIAFDLPKGVVDGNILRIISRLYGKEDNIALAKTRKIYGQMMDRMIAYAEPAVFNQAMMDLGAMVCTPRKPDCGACPLQKMCIARQLGKQQLLPVNIKKTGQKKEDYMTAVIRYEDRYMLIRNKGGMLENLYGFVQYPLSSPTSFEERFGEEFGLKLKLKSYVRDVRHVFTHRIWQMHVYTGELVGPPGRLDECFHTFKEIEALPVSTAHLKVLKAAVSAGEQEQL